ncbi:hypothetical protein PENSUB_4554 [Penicillium subrubescens]|uniref:Uncharacterized protein n=1 Tax=Penicillium subrubescens TaxID=1316194 RepID=A0A1Q5UCA1_9EURO|nr:hypothetical protein PENSUB_4554 [Penicillium subrubescens]
MVLPAGTPLSKYVGPLPNWVNHRLAKLRQILEIDDYVWDDYISPLDACRDYVAHLDGGHYFENPDGSSTYYDPRPPYNA